MTGSDGNNGTCCPCMGMAVSVWRRVGSVSHTHVWSALFPITDSFYDMFHLCVLMWCWRALTALCHPFTPVQHCTTTHTHSLFIYLHQGWPAKEPFIRIISFYRKNSHFTNRKGNVWCLLTVDSTNDQTVYLWIRLKLTDGILIQARIMVCIYTNPKPEH